jgi:hypothetical protein
LVSKFNSKQIFKTCPAILAQKYVANIPIIWNGDRRDIIEEGLSSASYSSWVNTERELDRTATEIFFYIVITSETTLAKGNVE